MGGDVVERGLAGMAGVGGSGRSFVGGGGGGAVVVAAAGASGERRGGVAEGLLEGIGFEIEGVAEGRAGGAV